jgi:hypothetical protein
VYHISAGSSLLAFLQYSNRVVYGSSTQPLRLAATVIPSILYISAGSSACTSVTGLPIVCDKSNDVLAVHKAQHSPTKLACVFYRDM